MCIWNSCYKRGKALGGSKITILVMGKTMGKLSKVQNHNKQTDESRKYYFYEFQSSNITALFITGYSKKSVSRTVFEGLYCCFIQKRCLNND